MGIKKIIIFVLCILVTLVFRTLTFAFDSSISMRLKADSGTNCSLHNCSLSTWANQVSGSGYSTGAITLVPGIVYDNVNFFNYNPVIKFTNTTNTISLNWGIQSGVNDFGMIAVARTTRVVDVDSQSLAGTQGVGGSQNYLFHPSHGAIWSNTPFSSSVHAGAGVSFGRNAYVVYEHDVSYLPSLATYTNTFLPKQYLLMTEYNNKQPSIFVDGKLKYTGLQSSKTYVHPSSGVGYAYGYFLGDVAEIVMYDKSLSNIQENIVFSYLAVKYGITLDQTGLGQHYVDGSGNVVWNSSNNSGYNNNIFGIGRDDSTSLYQKQSQSVNTGVLTIALDQLASTNQANTSTLSDRNFIIGGDNNGTLSLSESFHGNTNSRLGRVWKFEKTGTDTPLIEMIFTGITTSGLSLIVSTDDVFDVSDSIISLSGNTTQYPSTDDISYFTLALITKHTLSFEEEGGTEVLDQTGIVYNTTGANPGAPIKTGYVFNGWFMSGASNPFDFSTPITGDTILYAQRDLALYTLFFEENGGAIVSDQTGIVYNGTGFDPGAITKSGFIFEGWYYSGYTIPFDFTLPLTGDTTAYAMRTPFVDYRTEHYLENPDYSYPSTPVDILVSSGVSDSIIYATSNTYTGYTFDPSVPGTILSGIIIQDGSLVMKLYYPLIRYTLSFEENGGTVVLDQTGIVYNTPGTDPGVPTRIGYTFSGWYLSGASNPFDFSTPITSDTTLYAQWNPIPVIATYTLSFEENGGTLVSDQTGILLNGTGTQPTNPIRTGYIFGGWYTSPSLTTLYNFATPITSNTTLYAKWTAQPISGGGGGGYTIPSTGTVDPETFNPSIGTSCFTPINKQTIDQGIQVSEAFKTAHQMLYSYELTRWQGTRDYRPFDYLTREEAARFMVEFAINVLCRKPNRSYAHNFNDLGNSNPTLTKYIRMSYEYDIFHGDQVDESSKVSTTFRPKDKISRDEIIATMVRLVTNEYDEGLGESWASQYKSFLSRHVKAQLSSNARKDIAVTIYDLYRNNDYHMEDIGYVITY